MKMKVIILLGCLALSHGLPVDEELDTEFIDATTVSSNAVEPTLAPIVPFTNEDEIVIDATDSHSGNGRDCTTARGLKGVCSPVQDCLKVLFPVDYANRTSSQGPPYNEELAMMLVERSGFCEGNEKIARHDVTPGVFRQVMRSEVQICCKVDEPHQFKLDEVPEEPFKSDGCGVIKISLSELSLNATDDDITMPIIQNLTDVDRIVKGRKTKPGEFPWMVAMMNRNRQFCGGSLINSRTVLTAAHCVEQMSATDVKNLKLQLGDWNIYSKADGDHVVRSVSAVKYHKGFSQKHLRNDIALLIMDKPVKYTDRIQPVCLHTGNPSVDTGSMKADVAGWGALSEGGKQPSDLRAVKVRVLTRGQCRQKYSGNANKLSDGMVCAGSDNGEDSCQGDSGGPLTVDSRSQAKQIGVVSWGIGCGRYPGVYTAVYRYLAWVDKHKAA